MLQHRLLEQLRRAPQGRIINVSSGAHKTGSIHWEDPHLTRSFGVWRAYSQSKLANILFTRELARRVPAAEVIANTMHPGVVATDLLFNGWAPLRLLKPFIRTPAQGARTAVHLAASPEVAGVTGEYFRDERPVRPWSAALDDGAARRLWEMSAEMTGLR